MDRPHKNNRNLLVGEPSLTATLEALNEFGSTRRSKNVYVLWTYLQFDRCQKMEWPLFTAI